MLGCGCFLKPGLLLILHPRYLPVLLGPPEAWRSAATSTPGPLGRAAALRSAAAARAHGMGSRLQAVVDQFKAIAVSAYKWVAAGWWLIVLY